MPNNFFGVAWTGFVSLLALALAIVVSPFYAVGWLACKAFPWLEDV